MKEKKLWITESDKGGFICLFDPVNIGQIGATLLEDRTTFEPVDEKCEKRTLAAIRALFRGHPTALTNMRESTSKTSNTRSRICTFSPKSSNAEK